jgi:hypothetical protein
VSGEGGKIMKETDYILVCSECKRASCWRGLFMCEEARGAGSVAIKVEQLRELGLEDPSYWASDAGQKVAG